MKPIMLTQETKEYYISMMERALRQQIDQLLAIHPNEDINGIMFGCAVVSDLTEDPNSLVAMGEVKPYFNSVRWRCGDLCRDIKSSLREPF